MIRKHLRNAFGFGGLRQKLIHGAAWTGLGTGVGQAGSLLAGVIAARMLGPADYGRYGLLQSTIAICSLVSGFGLSATATRYLSASRSRDVEEAGAVIGSTFTMSLWFSTAVALVVLVFAPWIANSMANDQGLAKGMRIGAAFLFVASLAGVVQGVQTGFQSFRGAAATTMLRGVALVPLTVFGIWYAGINGAISALTSATTIALAFGLRRIWKICKRNRITPRFAVRSRDWKMIGSFAIPSVLGGILLSITNWSVSRLVARVPGGFAELGILTAGIQYRTIMIFFQSSIGTVLLPMMASADRKHQASLLYSAIRLNCLVGFGLCLVAAISPDSLMSLYGKAFAGHKIVVLANVFSGALILSCAPIGSWISSLGRQWVLFSLNALWCVVYFSVAMAAVQMGYGATGVAAASAIAFVIQILGYVILVFSLRRLLQPVEALSVDSDPALRDVNTPVIAGR